MTMTMTEFNAPSLPRRILNWSVAFGLPASLIACAGQPSPTGNRIAILNLDSLHRVIEHKDSVESNYFFYEEAFTAYKAVFLGVDKPSFMAVARGKDQAFCLFRPDPGRLCLDVGDKFKALGLGEPARDAYEAALLSEGVNGDTLNIRLWSRMAELHIGWGESEQAVPYLTKVLEVDEKNKWARKMLASRTGKVSAADPRQMPLVDTSFPGPFEAGRPPVRGRRSQEGSGRLVDNEALRKGSTHGL